MLLNTLERGLLLNNHKWNITILVIIDTNYTTYRLALYKAACSCSGTIYEENLTRKHVKQRV
jgi:hypothetical protein